MRHRIFIAINLPEDAKKKLANFQLKWPELPARWTKKENLHITLEFLRYAEDQDLPDVLEEAREMAKKQEPHFISLNKIVYGPPNKFPRMVWATGESYHITLARIKEWEFRKMEPEERPEINENINISFEVNSIEVMESQLKRGGPEYAVLESIPLETK